MGRELVDRGLGGVSAVRVSPVVLLHGVLVAGLGALWIRYRASLLASRDFDGFFDGYSILLAAGFVALLTFAILLALAIWYRAGARLPLVLADGLVALILAPIAVGRVVSSGNMTAGRLLAMGVAVVAILAATAAWRHGSSRATGSGRHTHASGNAKAAAGPPSE